MLFEKNTGMLSPLPVDVLSSMRSHEELPWRAKYLGNAGPNRRRSNLRRGIFGGSGFVVMQSVAAKSGLLLLLAVSCLAQGNGKVDNSAIRREDLEDEMTVSFLRSVHATTIHEACKDALGTGIEISTKAYGDLDGDGREEAAVTAFSCQAGNGGPDLIAVFTLNPNGTVRELPIEMRKWNEPFKGRDPSIGLRGQMTVAIENNRLIEKFPIFKDTDPGCCASAGVREFIYRWKVDRLVLDDVVDTATPPAEHPPGPSREIRGVDVKKLLEDNRFGLVPASEMEELKEECADNGRDLIERRKPGVRRPRRRRAGRSSL